MYHTSRWPTEAGSKAFGWLVWIVIATSAKVNSAIQTPVQYSTIQKRRRTGRQMADGGRWSLGTNAFQSWPTTFQRLPQILAIIYYLRGLTFCLCHLPSATAQTHNHACTIKRKSAQECESRSGSHESGQAEEKDRPDTFEPTPSL